MAKLRDDRAISDKVPKAEEVVDGEIRCEGCTLAEWVPDIVSKLVAASDPMQVILFGSVARGDDGPDSDIDLLVVLPGLAAGRRREMQLELQQAVKAPMPIEVHPVDPERFEARRRIVGAVEEAAATEGVVVHGPPLEQWEWAPDWAAQAHEAARWLRYAGEDLRGAEHFLAAPDPHCRPGCYHAQQAVEKALKAALVHDAVRLPRSRDLDDLARRLPERWSVRTMVSELEDLQQRAADIYEPGDDPTLEDAESAIDLARRVVASVRADMASDDPGRALSKQGRR